MQLSSIPWSSHPADAQCRPPRSRSTPTQSCRDFLKGVIFHFKRRSWAVRVDVVMYNVASVQGTAQVILRIMRTVARAPMKPIQVARYALMAIFRPILLAVLTFAVMASSVPISASALLDVLAAGAGPGRAGRVTRFVCAHCTSSGKLSSHCLFLNRAAVLCHIAASKPCHAADAGIQTIQVEEARAGDVMDSWPARVARRGPGRTSDTSLQVMCIPSSASILLIPSKSHSSINTGGAVV